MPQHPNSRANLRPRSPASGIPAGGPGRDYGPAKGASTAQPFSATNQPPGELKAAGKSAKAAFEAAITARLSEVKDTLFAVLGDATVPAQARISAAVALMDRALGKPTQPVEHTTTNPDDLTDEQLAAIVAAEERS